ncbi:MAG TPA: trehalose-6-phosphate synthase [Actinophytocola sp.]|jgi:trehalose 6-phosphate synthase|uniref:alpha,alpha-trehalose-phosphate synthase (UDP-forming) n=1 Tax=Actinophytocola sp. TaxID=1872138 RepID=UPI002F91E9E2
MTVTAGPAPLVIASNRGPVELCVDEAGRVVANRGGGGLIGVLGPALASRNGTWIASALTEEDRRAARQRETGAVVELPEGSVRLRLLDLDRQDYDGYYRDISNGLLWFLHHHMLDPTREPAIDAGVRESWRAYRRINARFASACARELALSGQALLQDYHLSLAPRQLRALRPDAGIAHFTMIPWADPANLRALPADLATELLDGMLGADLLGFLVPRWANAFVETCAVAGYPVDRGRGTVIDRDGRRVKIRCFPVGVDPDRLRHVAAGAAAEAYRRELRRLVGDRRLVVRVDRMEPSKNLLRGLDGFAELIAREPARRERVVHYVLAYSSRQDVPAYQAYDREVRRRVDLINERFGTPTWQPVVLETRNDFARGLAALTLADVLVVNAMRDGMNLVAKEGPVVSRRDLALVLSTEVGAADELADAAIMVHPFDVTALADGIAAGLDMPRAERAERLARLRKAAGAMPPRQWLDQAVHESADRRTG